MKDGWGPITNRKIGINLNTDVTSFKKMCLKTWHKSKFVKYKYKKNINNITLDMFNRKIIEEYLILCRENLFVMGSEIS